MKKYLFSVLTVCLLLLNNSNAQEHAIPEIPRINAELAYLKYKNGSVIIVDAMSQITYRKYHILGAINLPADEGPPAQERIRAARLPIPLDKEIILYCD